MARRKSPILTEKELQLMNVLWDKGEATVGNVVSALTTDGRAPAYSSVLTMLRVLKQKGLARFRKDGRAYVYAPNVARSEVRKSTLRYLISRFFDDSPEELVLNLLEHEDLSAEELSRLELLIREEEPDDT